MVWEEGIVHRCHFERFRGLFRRHASLRTGLTTRGDDIRILTPFCIYCILHGKIGKHSRARSPDSCKCYKTRQEWWLAEVVKE